MPLELSPFRIAGLAGIAEFGELEVQFVDVLHVPRIQLEMGVQLST
jgi:hypothetical protein